MHFFFSLSSFSFSQRFRGRNRPSFSEKCVAGRGDDTRTAVKKLKRTTRAALSRLDYSVNFIPFSDWSPTNSLSLSFSRRRNSLTKFLARFLQPRILSLAAAHQLRINGYFIHTRRFWFLLFRSVFRSPIVRDRNS